ncbi:PQQ-dependent sugar dehydrogenase [Haloferula sp. BvORR071]|uniref:PQQ-dependent sugar dehydrogenase n=1 Tax=Haloferula sp. BvORR071 TaxID=1396141 RepID=UPI002240EB0A|nr:PQQ-dependent sugar dehydrogenase [Haloferula sp. BvORR071]
MAYAPLPLSAATGALTNPHPVPLPSGVSVEVKSWLTIPASSTSTPKARINHLKPCPGESRLFCNDLRGKLWAISSTSATSASEFLDLSVHFPGFINTPGLGTGFASFTFHPEFRQVGAPGYGKFYTAHSENAGSTAPDFVGPGATDLSQIGIVTEWTMSNPAATAITTSPANFTKREILRFGFPYDFHDLQEIEFDPTATPGSENYGCLFVCMGDGGSIVLDQPGNIGRIDSPLGCIHRITPVIPSGQSAANFTLSKNGKYYIPSGPANANPYVTATDPTPGDGFPVVREIYAYGFRNPHRISWDRGGSHKMFCGNIGESTIEEIEVVTKGTNHGWPQREGAYLFDYTDKTHVYPLPASSSSAYVYPVSQYDHNDGRAAVAGGFVYRGTGIPELQGNYICGDIVSGGLFMMPESAMNLAPTTNTADTPAPPKLLGVETNGVATSFRSMLGASRADLRLGQDQNGELYLLSKQNGTIYRVKADTSIGNPPPYGDGDDWTILGNFENGILPAMNQSVAGSSVQVVNDPTEGAVNRVMRLRSAGSTTLNTSIAIPPIPDGSRGTVFFRFCLIDQNHEHRWGLSEATNPSSATNLKVQLRSINTNPGRIEVSDANTFGSAFDAQAKTWYSVWLQVNNASGTANDSFDVYVKGGSYGVPTLVKTGVKFTAGISAALKTFYWRLAAGTEIYFDDLYVDSGHINLSDPVAQDWRLIDHFEGVAPLDSWEIPGAAAQSVGIVTEPSGNRYLRRTASSSAAANANAIIAKPLPFTTQVSQTLTLFFRMRLEGTNLKHSFGASATDPADPALYTENDFAPQWRISPGGMISMYDGPAGTESFLPATTNGTPCPALQSDVWYNVWLVASNRGVASGGQTWQAYIQGGVHSTQVQLGGTMHFRRQAESPITHFLNIAATGSGTGNQAIDIDDLHAYQGMNLGDPLAPDWAPTSLERNGSQVTLSYATRDNRAFQLFESSDLKGWQPLGAAVEGDSSWQQMTLPIDRVQRFFQAAELSRRGFHAASWSSDFSGEALPAGLVLSASSTWAHSDGLLTLSAAGSQVSGMVARPCGYALIPGDWRNVTFNLEGHTLRSPSTTQRDIVMIFGYVDETHFYYAHIAGTSNSTTQNVIVKVDGTTATPIQSPASPPVKLTSNWQTYRVTHSATGAIAVYADNMSTPFMTANDTTFPVGRLGFGSYDDTAEFRMAAVSGEQP